MAPFINNYFHEKPSEIRRHELKVDIVSKIFAVLELCLGINRLNIVGIKYSIIGVTLMWCYSMLVHLTTLYKFSINFKFHVLYILEFPDAIQCVVCTAMSFIFRERLIFFYSELTKFDDETRFVPKISAHSLYNLVKLIATVVISAIFSSLSDQSEALTLYLMHLYVMKLLHVLEIHYYGHLISLLIPRLKLLSQYLEISCHTAYEDPVDFDRDCGIIIHTEKGNPKLTICLKKLMALYNNIIGIYDILYEAIKWQMLSLITASFTVSSVVIYSFIICAVKGEKYLNLLYINTSFAVLELVPLVVPCIFADQVTKEVCHLRNLITRRLYEKTLDKSGRRTARALLVLTKTRNLAFSLFHMFDIDISLPIKLMGLLLTYVVIMLQLDKYITPIGTL